MRWSLVLALTAAIATSACGSGTGPSGSGTLRMMIKDSPFRDAKALLVTFSQVDVHRSDSPDGSWEHVMGVERTCDLKRLETSVDALGAGTLTSGHYTQIRFLVTRAVVYFDNGTTEANACSVAPPAGDSASVTIPSGEVKLNRAFDVPEGGATTVTIDFDGEKSVHQTGSGEYMMSPVISVVSVQ
jgi:Domain of unknown function (DUF4382)